MDTQFAPGCFGSALTYKAGSKVCDACPFAEECAPQSEERLAAVRAMFGITAKGRSDKPASPRPALSQASQALLDKISEPDLAVARRLAAGENPFEGTKIGFMKVVCHLLLNLPTGLSRELLCQALERKLNWSRATAVSHANQATQALKTLGVVVERDGKLQLLKG